MKFVPQNRNLFIIALIAVVNALGYGIIIPILYSYSVRFGLSDFQNGLLFALFSTCQFLSTPVIGRLSDKYGRKPLLLASLVGTTVSFFMMAFAPSALFLFLARALDGITAGNLPVAQAVISDSTTTPTERAKAFGIIGASFGFGFIAGPAISALTVAISPILPFIVAGIVSIIAVVITGIFLPETNKHMGEVTHAKLFDIRKLLLSVFDPDLGKIFLITLLYFCNFGLFIYAFQPFSLKVLHLQPTQISIVYTIFGIVGLISQLLIVQRATKLMGVKNGFSVSIFVVALSLILMFLSQSLLVFILASVIFGVFNSIQQALSTTIISLETDAKSQGSVMGLNTSYMSIGQIIGPIVGGMLASFYIPLPFLAGSVLVLVCFVLSLKIAVLRSHKEHAF
jgi:MFS family permease